MLFEMNLRTELLAYVALALVAYAVALLLLWLWFMNFVDLGELITD